MSKHKSSWAELRHQQLDRCEEKARQQLRNIPILRDMVKLHASGQLTDQKWLELTKNIMQRGAVQ